ncbi:condensation domain-containing protein [Streptomyces sp. NPDC088923]|uniref:condensation domain-containing protein n=1 Tax=Streptomyces sp. NPDC088923 TaxID=3365913 RepID=UPI003810F4AD
MTRHQEYLWLQERINPDEAAAFNISLTLRIRGAVDVPALRAAFHRLAERHEVFRTSIMATANGPAQFVDPEPGTRLLVERRFGLVDEESRAEAASRLADEASGHLFDLSSGGLLHSRLVTLDPDDHVLSLTLHHLIADGWSTDLLWRDLAEYYAAECEGREPVLPVLPVQFADYAHWQRTRPDDRVVRADLAYWQERLGAPAEDLPGPRPPGTPASPSRSTADSLSALIDASAYARLREVASSMRATPFIVMGAAFACVAARRTGRPDGVFVTLDHGRSHRELDDTVGSFAHPQILRVPLEGDPSFAEVVERTRETVAGAREHGTVSLGQIIERLCPGRVGPARHGLLPSLAFQLQPRSATPPAAFGSASVEPVVPRKHGTGFDLLLTAEETAEGLRLICESAPDFCTREEAEAQVAAFLDILDRAVADPGLGLVQLLGHPLPLYDGPRPPEGPTPRARPAHVVPLRHGMEGSGTPPLFLVPPISGSPLCYLGLARRLPGDGPVLGLRAPGLDGEQGVLSNAGDLADHYAAAVRMRRPRGPYLLAGWSAGGLLAYETARRLTDAGQRVALLAMIEPTPLREFPVLSGPEAMSLFAEDLAHSLGRTQPTLDCLEEPGLDEQEALVRLRSVLVRAELLPEQASESFVANRFAVFRANLQAVNTYSPGNWSGQPVYVQGTGSPDFMDTWRDATGTAWERADTPGDHYSMWSPEYLPALAHLLGESMEAVPGERHDCRDSGA